MHNVLHHSVAKGRVEIYSFASLATSESKDFLVLKSISPFGRRTGVTMLPSRFFVKFRKVGSVLMRLTMCCFCSPLISWKLKNFSNGRHKHFPVLVSNTLPRHSKPRGCFHNSGSSTM